MDGIAVARRCADLTQEIFEVAKMSVKVQQRQRIERNNQTPSLACSITGSDSSTNNPITLGIENTGCSTRTAIPQVDPSQAGIDMWGSMDGFSIDSTTLEEDFLASLIDPKILDSFGANLMSEDLMDQYFFEGLDFSQGMGV
jgi:hypothetical protein